MDINYFNRKLNKFEIEKVYGSLLIEFLYASFYGRLLGKLLAYSPFSKFYGWIQSRHQSAKKIPKFIKDFKIKMEDFETDVSEPKYYNTFNDFFIRKLKKNARPWTENKKQMPAFCEGRYFGYKSLTDDLLIPVKGKYLNSEQLLKNSRWQGVFEGGPVLIGRLCPVDYHRFHFPDDGKVIDSYRLHGKYHSVNPIALKNRPDIFVTNERHVTIIETENFKKLAYIEVGAMAVGKIVQSYNKDSFMRADEKGYFLFGGSTVIIVGEKGAWSPTDDILDYTKKGIEVYVELGDQVAHI